jgi:hypothetical protein
MTKPDRMIVQIEPKLKTEAERILDEPDLCADEAIRVFRRQVVL